MTSLTAIFNFGHNSGTVLLENIMISKSLAKISANLVQICIRGAVRSNVQRVAKCGQPNVILD